MKDLESVQHLAMGTTNKPYNRPLLITINNFYTPKNAMQTFPRNGFPNIKFKTGYYSAFDLPSNSLQWKVRKRLNYVVGRLEWMKLCVSI